MALVRNTEVPTLVRGHHSSLDGRQEGFRTDPQERIRLSGPPLSPLLQSPSAPLLHRLRPCCPAVSKGVPKVHRQYSKCLTSFWSADLGGRKQGQACTAQEEQTGEHRKATRSPAYCSWKCLSLVTSSLYWAPRGAIDATSTNISCSRGPVSLVALEGQRVRLTSW